MSEDFAPLAPDPLDSAFSSEWLMDEIFAPIEYVVPGLIPEGLTLLTAAPKIGKSWMVLGLGYAAATGGMAFGKIRVQQRPVLYLALEDGPRRLQSRLRTIGVATGHPDLTLMTAPPPGVAVTDVIAAFLERHAGQQPLVVLDTLGKIRGVYSGSDAYGRDYSQMSQLKDLTDAWPGSSLIVVHHTKKAETTDFLDSVSGTQGLAGAADSILVLRRERQSEGAVLHVTSRDALEGEYAVTLTDGTWTLDGSDLASAAQAVETARATQNVGDDMGRIVHALADHPDGIKAPALGDELGLSADTAGRYLRRAVEAGRATKLDRGLYGPVRSVRSVRNGENGQPQSDTTDTSDTVPQGLIPLQTVPRTGTCSHGQPAGSCFRCKAEAEGVA